MTVTDHLAYYGGLLYSITILFCVIYVFILIVVGQRKDAKKSKNEKEFSAEMKELHRDFE